MFDDEIEHSPRHRLPQWAQEDTEVCHLNDRVLEEGENSRENVALDVNLIQLTGGREKEAYCTVLDPDVLGSSERVCVWSVSKNFDKKELKRER